LEKTEEDTMRRRPVVPPAVVDQIQDALDRVDRAGTALDAALTAGAPLPVRRQTRARLKLDLEAADGLLRGVALLVRGHSYLEWSTWRHRLSRLDTVRQSLLLADHDDLGVIPPGSIRAVDTGMSGPDIGDLQHGRSRPVGAPATYGLDMDPVLGVSRVVTAAPAGLEPATRAAVVVPLPTPTTTGVASADAA
jgi:hypothetical protein